MSSEDKKKIIDMIATKVANKLTLKINSGTTEGTNLYTYDGSSSKTLNFKPGTGIGFTTAAGAFTISNSGVRSITTGDNNGTIKVNTNGTNTNVAVKGLGSAAYTNSSDYSVSKTLTAEDLDDVIIPGFYNSGGGNTVTNKPSGVEHFGLEVIHGASGAYYVQILFEDSFSNVVWRRHCQNGTWSAWTKDSYTDTHWTSHLYVGAKSSNNNNASNAATTNGNTYLKLFDDSTLRHQYNIKGTGNTTVTSDASGNIVVNSPTTLAWGSITGKPTIFTPGDHTHATNKITASTGYSKATSASAIAATDSLNTALGKLEYKADLGKTAYDWYKSVTDTDTDTLINKWGEIVGFLDSVAEGTDIIDEFVTRKTAQVITGKKNFNTNTNASPLVISRTGGTTEAVSIGVNDSQAIFEYVNDEKSNAFVFKLINNDTESSDGSGANTNTVTFTGSSSGSTVAATTLQGRLAYTYLTGSGTTKDQAIVSSGTANGWTLKTLGSHAFDSTAYLPLAGGQMNSTAFIAWNSGAGGNDLADWSITDNGLRIISSIATTSNAPTQYATGLHVKGRYGFQIASQGGDTSNAFFIKNVHNTTWNTLLHSNNYTTYVSTTNFPGLNKTGTVTSVTVKGANGLSGSGTITTSGTITLSNAGVRSATISGDYLKVNTNGTDANLTIPYATASSYLKVTACRGGGSNSKLWDDPVVDAQKVKVWDVYNDEGPTTYGNILEINGITSHWKPQLWFDSGTGQMRVRNRSYNVNEWNAWRIVLDSANYASYTPILNSATTHATSSSVIYAPTTAGTLGHILTSNGSGAPIWTNPANIAIGTASNGVFYIEGTGSTAGTWLGSHAGITSYYKGLTIAYKIPVKGADTTTLNINSLGAKIIRRNDSALTTHVPVNSVIVLVYDGTYFRWSDYDANSYAYVRQYITDSTNEEYPLLFRHETSTTSTYVTKYTRYDSAITVNPSTNTITATSFKGNLIGTAADSDKLGGSAAANYLLKSDLATQELTSNLTTITKSLTVTAAWMDTGIEGANIPTNGTYIVQVYAHNSTDNLWYGYWSGVMSWYASGTNDTDTDEIILHRSGHAYGNTIYLRTAMNSNGKLKLQIAANKTLTTAADYTFKFKRII